MIKVRVDWHSLCPGCGTQLAVDFFGGSSDRVICPWCGYLYETDHASRRDELRQYLESAIKELESNVNAEIPV
jgi:hypothetical protein